MAGGSLLTLLDDIATLLDDVSIMSKVAMKKTAGVLGDDLALNAQQVAGVSPQRELPVVWAVAVGSLKNKAILVPAALLISAFAPWAIQPLLMIGGLFLCYEGFEKVWHKLFAKHHAEEGEQGKRLEKLADPNIDLVAMEKGKINGAIRTDFILSAEIVVITLGVLQASDFWTRVAVLVAVALMITVGVYGLVAMIVKLDDFGLYLLRDRGDDFGDSTKRSIGRMILRLAPVLMRTLGVAGTIAMFLVGGGIIAHSWPVADGLHHIEEWLEHHAAWFAAVGKILLEGTVGIIAGGIVVAVMSLVPKRKEAASAH